MQIAYGHEIKSDGDRYIKLAQEIDESVELMSGSAALQLFPFRESSHYCDSLVSTHEVVFQSNIFHHGFQVLGSSAMHKVKVPFYC